MNRRTMLKAAALAVAGAAVPVRAALPAVRVYKAPGCECCAGWVAHLRDFGFSVNVEETGNAGARARLGIPSTLGSCHTAEVGGYAIEGHVPATDVARLLAERPRARGLAVPGMPIGSPGMEQGDRRDAYVVLLVKSDATTAVYSSYSAANTTRKEPR